MTRMSATVRRSAAAAAFGLLVLLGAGATRVAATSGDHLTFFTFRRSVALPGVTLPPGTYAFQIANVDGASNIVMVRDRARRQSLFLGFTYRTPRPEGWSEKRQIVLGESGPGDAAPILAWYPVDNATGYEFIYRR